ncbi:MAG: hypothetical protein ACE5HE_00865 [Phycisphaerae bacterium]
MPDEVNRIRNPDFSRGRCAPAAWVFNSDTRGACWHRPGDGRVQRGPGVKVSCESKKGTALFSQVLTCRPGEFYRVEATVACHVEAMDGSGGAVLRIQPVKDDLPVGRLLTTPSMYRTTDAVAIRAYYEAPKGIRRVRLSVGLVTAAGWVLINHVRFIRILDPEEESHVLAIPPPAHVVVPPRVAGSVCVCSAQAEERPITRMLEACFGSQSVRAMSPADLSPSAIRTDALLLPDATLPPTVTSLRTLTQLAAERIVVVSLPAFARLSNGMVALKRIEQDDDPIHAKVVHASHATHGFALHDVFAYAWPGRSVGSFVQNQYRKDHSLKSFCIRHRLATVLVSVCDRDATSDRPVCLHRPSRRGGLYVLDIEPAEASGSTMSEPTLAFHLLLSILGRAQASLGQYSVAAADEVDLRAHIRDMAERFAQFNVHDEDVPTDEVTEQLVVISPPVSASGDRSRPPEALGYPAPVQLRPADEAAAQPRPVILVRTGLTGGDLESVYGAWTWFKQLVRPEPFACPYFEQLTSRFRLAWIPLLARWEPARGWRRSGSPAVTGPIADLAETDITALIDVVARPVNRVRVLFSSRGEDYDRYASWLPRLVETLPPGRYFHPALTEGDAYGNRNRYAWRHVKYEPLIIADSTMLDDPVYRELVSSGAQAIRIEIPSCEGDYSARSIQSTDLVATLLEHIIGLQYGLLAVNRTRSPVRLGALPPVEPGDALILHRADAALRTEVSRTG